MRILSSFILSALVLCLWIGCTTAPKKARWDLPAISPNEVSVASFNVENLFDTAHDEERDDFTYLPKAQKNTEEFKKLCARMQNPFYQNECLNLDWSEEVLQAKMKNLAEVILGIDGRGPDNLMLMEIENEGVLKRLNREYLTAAGYQTAVLIEGPDKRGIDVGFLSRFPLVGKPELHRISFVASGDAEKERLAEVRGILEVGVRLPDESVLTFLGVHFPSQSNPHSWRAQAAQYLNGLIKAKGPKAQVIALGDFNVTQEEEENSHLIRDNFKDLDVSHFVGCKTCPGTHHYKKNWSFLDAQVYSAALSATGKGSYVLEPETIDVIRYNPIHLVKGEFPRRFDPEKKAGVSDHFPLYARLKKREATAAAPTAPTNASTPETAPTR